jgi:hypothetical protein
MQRQFASTCSHHAALGPCHYRIVFRFTSLKTRILVAARPKISTSVSFQVVESSGPQTSENDKGACVTFSDHA